MSQIIKSLAAGPVPPSVPTQFTADDATIGIPAANNLNLFSQDTINNNANGIQTTANPNLSDNFFIELTNRISVTATTSDGGGQTQNVNLFTPANGTSIAFTVLITGYDTANNETTGGEIVGIARAAGGTLVVVGTNDTFDEADAGLGATDWDIIDTASPILQVQFVGVAGRTINWRALFEYTQAP